MSFVIIDVGAHDGSITALPWSQDVNNVVYAIEPNPKFSECLKSYNLPNLKVFSCAMGDSVGTKDFYINSDDQTSSLLPAKCIGDWQAYKENLRNVEVVQVNICRLDIFAREQGLTEVHLLKVDAQGFDLQVLQGAGEFLHSVQKIQLEVQLQPLYEGSSTKDEVLEYLTSRGFSLLRTVPQTNGLEENLEFIRTCRYPLTKSEVSSFDVQLPFVGALKTPKDDLVGKLLEEGSFEGLEQAFLWLYLRTGDTFVDCGTHAGLFSAVAARCIGNNGKIFGFDPNPICSRLYKENLSRLGYQNFIFQEVGLSDQDGSAELLLGKEGMSAFSTFAASSVDSLQIGPDTAVVAQRTLDSIVCEFKIAHVALTKLDVEGWEPFVLKGAQQSISSGLFPVWMIEFTESNAIAAGSSTKELRLLLETYGYTLCRFDATRLCLSPEPQCSHYLYDNLFAVMDLDAVNERLALAEIERVNLAKEIIVRYDLAVQRDGLATEVVHLRSELQSELLKLRQFQAELQQSQAELQQSQAEFQQSQAEFQQSQAELQQSQAELYHVRRIIRLFNPKTVLKKYLPSAAIDVIREVKNRSNKLVLDQKTEPRPLEVPKHYFNTLLKVSSPPLVSIVTPSYNHARYIERTIMSVIEQGYPNLEYIVQDGASTDCTQAILANYTSKITRVVSQPDTGQANAINLGFKESQGEIMAWLNSDDLLLPGTLAYVVNYFHENPDVDVVYGHRILIDVKDQIIGKWVLPPHDNDLILWADYIPQETLFWRRSIWEKSGSHVDESYQFAMDWELILRFREQGIKFVRLPRFLGAFRVHPEQKTSALEASAGFAEMSRLRLQSHSYEPSHQEIVQKIRPYQNQAWLYYWLNRLQAVCSGTII
jgi:FkbM family methyltransferase